MNIVKRWLSRLLNRAVVIEVDYDKPLYIPNGAIGVAEHTPVGVGRMPLEPSGFELRELPRGMTYDRYIAAHGDDLLCDAAVLDGIVAYITTDGLDVASIARRSADLFGDFRGQIFFLGTTFASRDGVAHVPFLNVGTYMPALRYACPLHDPMNSDFDVRVCHLAPIRPMVGP